MRGRREHEGFWEFAWTREVQNPNLGAFSKNDLRWSYYHDDAFAWIYKDRVGDFIRGEEENEIAPTKFNYRHCNQQNWKEGDFLKANHYVRRTKWSCKYGPEITLHLKEKPNRKRNKVGKKTGCQCQFIVCIMRGAEDRACVIYKEMQHVDINGIRCHGLPGPTDENRKIHHQQTSKEMNKKIATEVPILDPSCNIAGSGSTCSNELLSRKSSCVSETSIGLQRHDETDLVDKHADMTNISEIKHAGISKTEEMDEDLRQDIQNVKITLQKFCESMPTDIQTVNAIKEDVARLVQKYNMSQVQGGLLSQKRLSSSIGPSKTKKANAAKASKTSASRNLLLDLNVANQDSVRDKDNENKSAGINNFFPSQSTSVKAIQCSI